MPTDTNSYTNDGSYPTKKYLREELFHNTFCLCVWSVYTFSFMFFVYPHLIMMEVDSFIISVLLFCCIPLSILGLYQMIKFGMALMLTISDMKDLKRKENS